MDRLHLSNDSRGTITGLSLSPIASPKNVNTKLPDTLPNPSIVLEGREIQLVATPPWPFNFINVK